MCVFSVHGADIEFSWCHKCERYEYIHFRQSKPVTRLVKIANHINHYPYWTHCWTKKKIGGIFLCVLNELELSLWIPSYFFPWWLLKRFWLGLDLEIQSFFSLHSLLQGLSCYSLLHRSTPWFIILAESRSKWIFYKGHSR